MQTLLIILTGGLGVGGVYAMLAMSFNVVYNSSAILNFANGQWLLLGTLLALYLSSSTNVAVWLGIAIASILIVSILASIQGYVTLLPLRDPNDQHSWLVMTLAVATMLEALVLLIHGAQAVAVNSILPPIAIGESRIPSPYIVAVVLALGLYMALRWFHQRIETGLAMSALSQDLDAARATGIRARRIQIAAFAISGAILGCAGYFMAPILAISGAGALGFLLNGFIAAIAGGLGHNGGSLAGGLGLGVLLNASIYLFGGEYEILVSVAILIGFLMIKPEGLFGRPTARRI